MHTLAVLLDWYRAMGADAALDDIAIDWFEREERAPGSGYSFAGPTETRLEEPRPTEPRTTRSPQGNSPQSNESPSRAPLHRDPTRPVVQPAPHRAFQAGSAPDVAELSARSSARTANSLGELETALRAFDGCGLKATAKNLCFYRGSERARLMIVGEAPGREEDLEGRPFVGPAGQLLDKMLAAIGLGEADVHITNVVYWRPPGNRTPTPQEAQVCRPFLERQIELVAPEALVLLGGAAAKHVLDITDGIMRIRGKWREASIGPLSIKALATLHPAYLLRTPAAKRLAWRDLLTIKAALARNGS